MADDLVAQLAANAMGIEAPAPAQPAAPDMAAPPAPAKDKPTVEEAAIAAASPQDEADLMGQDAIFYEVDGRKLTPSQIKGTMDRYRELNFQNQEMADLHRVAEIAGRMGLGSNPREVARAFAAMLKAQQSNPTMGNGSENAQPNPQDGDPLTKWEEENAAKLPPGYRELTGQMQASSGQMNQMMQMMQQLLANAGQAAGAGADAAVNARQERASVMEQRIRNNLEGMAQRVGLTPEQAQDFLIFSGERGYTLDDFIDPRLVGQVMTDYKNNAQSPEMERLRQVAQRRQAFTGNVAAAPSSGAPAAPQAPADATLTSLIDGALARRGGN